jgi:hypothetical protein
MNSIELYNNDNLSYLDHLLLDINDDSITIDSHQWEYDDGGSIITMTKEHAVRMAQEIMDYYYPEHPDEIMR